MTTSGFARPECLVEPEWVAARLDDPALRVFDCTTYLHPDPQTVYRLESGHGRWAEGHVPGSDHLGHEHVALYDGSLSEWVADPTLPMEVGPMQTGGAP